jgi:hypothetical protein
MPFLEAQPLAEVQLLSQGYTRKQLDALARNVEARRQQLEHGIDEYIRGRQEELRTYEKEVYNTQSNAALGHSRILEADQSAAASAPRFHGPRGTP